MSKKFLSPYPLIVDGDMSGDVLSDAFHVQTLDNIGLQLEWTGTPVGTFSVLVSNNYNPQLDTGDFRPLTLSAVPAAAGDDNGDFIDLRQIPAAYIKLSYTRTSGAGSLNVTATGKAV